MGKRRYRPASREELAILDLWYPIGGSPVVMRKLAACGYTRSRGWCQQTARERGLKAGQLYNPEPCPPKLQDRLNALERVMAAAIAAACSRGLEPSAQQVVSAALETLRARPETVDEINRGGDAVWQ